MTTRDATPPLIVVLMGVAGAGKTTIGRLLAARLGWAFVEGDAYHPPANIAKMAGGTPLTDQDRAGWLAALRQVIAARLAAGEPAVVASSALKQSYRAQLARPGEPVAFVYLKGTPALLRRRLEARTGHYMQPDMLASQLRALEEPESALTVDVSPPPDAIVETIIHALGLKPAGRADDA